MQTGKTILLLALMACQAGAYCNVPQPRLVCAEYFRSKAVVIAKLAGITPLKDTYGDVVGTYYSMTVEHAFRGQAPRLIRVYEGNDSGRATFEWKAGGSYLLFLREESLNGAWVVDGCGNSGPIELRPQALKKIEAIDPSSDRALIQGAVGGVSSSFPLAGVRVEASGPGDVRTAETKADGTFEIHVAPGKYQVRALQSGKTFVAEDISYEKPEGLVLEGGGCAQVQFVESAKKP